MVGKFPYACSTCGKPAQFANTERQCIACRVAAADTHHHAAAIALGLPPELLGYFVQESAGYTGDGSEIGKRLQPGYRFQFEGLYLPPVLAVLENRFWPVLILDDDQAGIFSIQIRRACLFYGDVPAFLEYRWLPHQGYTLVPRGLEEVSRQRDIDTLMRGVGLLHQLTRSGPGRPARYDSLGECREAVRQALVTLWADYDRPPHEGDIEFYLFGVENKGRQLRRSLKPYRWADIMAEVRESHPDL